MSTDPSASGASDDPRILLVVPLPPPINGCSYANEVLLKGIRALGFKVDIVDCNTPLIASRQGVSFSWSKALSFVQRYGALWRVTRASVLYLTPGQTFFGIAKYSPFMIVAWLLRKPYVIHVHGNHLGAQYRDLRGIKRWLFRWLISRAFAGIVLSESLRKNFYGLLPAENVHVVENFAGDELFFAGGELDKPVDHPRILYLSNLMEEKGILELLSAFELLKSRGVVFEATIAGHIEASIEGEVRKRLARLDEMVRYIGPVSGMQKFNALRDANVFVLPTYYAMEGQPISLLEGLAMGNIIVTTAHAGIPDIVDESNGYLVPVRDADSLARAIEEISGDLPMQLARFSSHNVRYAAGRFTERAFVGRIVNVLVEAAARYGRQTCAREEA